MQVSECLVTGSNGFIGSHLVESLAADPLNHVHAVFHNDYQNLTALKDLVAFHKVDFCDKNSVFRLLAECKPEILFHLASISSIPFSWQNPSLVFDINVKGTINLLEAVRQAGIDPTIIVTCSSSEYDPTFRVPLKEDSRLRPNSPYAVSKVAQDFIAGFYADAYCLKVVRVRPFFIIGPRQVTGACADFARGIVCIEHKLQEKLHVGNLNSVVDVLDVRDTVDGLILLAKRGEMGKIYNLSSGKGYTIKQLLDLMISLSQSKVEIQIDPTRFRPKDYGALVGDNSRLRQLGWAAHVPIETTLRDIMDFWRKEFKTDSLARKELTD